MPGTAHPYVYASQAEAEAASNALYLAANPNGTTELLWGWFINADGKYELAAQSQPSVDDEAPAA
ncbi:hypothetical protein [Burkholderia gladioli]|uniref:hypothetical protein n=1 Tax=Burkholderia gladioli TaxID=28095 RepID=UPI00163EAA4F|nr:hypothetical protein [Burkholderia gladioli]